MALIHEFKEVERDQKSVHKTTVECGWTSFEHNGEAYIQLDTYGSKDRKIPGKVSQSLQLNEARASELIVLLQKVFPRLS